MIKFQLVGSVFSVLAIPCYSQTGSIKTNVVVNGSVIQNSTGSNTVQEINIGGMSGATAGNFNSLVTTKTINQEANSSNVTQKLNLGGMKDSTASSFMSNVNLNKIEQIGRSGETQHIDIGSAVNSKIRGDMQTSITVHDGIKQIGDGEIIIGAVKNSEVGSFNNVIDVRKVEGNNIRIGSVIRDR